MSIKPTQKQVPRNYQTTLAAVRALAQTIAHDLAQPLTVLTCEIQLATVFTEAPDEASWLRMQEAASYITERLNHYQHIKRVLLTVNEAGILVLDTEAV
ncbi:MAG TPA: hypothetical protein VH186_33915 [Chloroflexia bacterium]|nr:hypothetical protein [Chloroflexia bacterium]